MNARKALSRPSVRTRAYGLRGILLCLSDPGPGTAGTKKPRLRRGPAGHCRCPPKWVFTSWGTAFLAGTDTHAETLPRVPRTPGISMLKPERGVRAHGRESYRSGSSGQRRRHATSQGSRAFRPGPMAILLYLDSSRPLQSSQISYACCAPGPI